MSRTVNRLLVTAGVAAALLAVGWLLVGTESPQSAVSDESVAASQVTDGSATGETAHEQTSQPAAEVATVTPDLPATAEADGQPLAERELVLALLQADQQARGPQILEAKRLLARVLHRYPHAAPLVARTLGEMQDRHLAFACARVLGRHVHDEQVRQLLLQHLEGGNEVAREASIYALMGLRNDQPVTEALFACFQDRAASESVQAAAACALVHALRDFEGPLSVAVQSEARYLVESPRTPSSVKAEALSLLDVKGDAGDRERARALLDEAAGAPPAVVLAAARELLNAGEPIAAVRPALERATAGWPGAAEIFDAVADQ